MTDGDAALGPGARVAEFEILRLLGAGGFGVTYLARDTSLACEVAVKEYFPARCAVRRKDATVAPRSRAHASEYRWGLERFLREARLLARFDDRRIVRVRRVFEAAGTAYLAMEHVEGRSLAAELKDVARLPEARVRSLMEQLAEALELVHAAGLVHRDIKPGNVMLRGDGTAVLIDFGTANPVYGERSELVQVTPPYAPLEQYGSGESSERRLGPWTDIYALGAVAYRALSGQRPVEAVERVPVDRLPPLQQVAPGTSRPFAAAVMSALAVDAGDRPQSVAAWRASWNDDAAAPAAFRVDWRLATGLGLAVLSAAAVLWFATGLRFRDAGFAEGVDVAAAGTADPVPSGIAEVASGVGRRAGRESESPATGLSDEAAGSPEAAPFGAPAMLVDRPALVSRRAPAAPAAGGGTAVGTVPPGAVAAFSGGTAAPDVNRGGERLPPTEIDALLPLSSFRDDCNACPELILVPAGVFVMGSDGHAAEMPTHRVPIRRFAVGRHEVTRGEYAAFVDATGRGDPVGCRVLNAAGGTGNDPRASWRTPGFAQHDDRHPVVCVSWADARAYVSWLSGQAGVEYRLPSEAEWEYVVRSGTTTRRHWGDGASGQCAHANGADRAARVRFDDWAGAGCDDGALYTAPVKSYIGNAFRVHDMLGNAAEWVADCWRSSYAGTRSRDGRPWRSGDPCGLRVLRGGSWASPPVDLRSAFRESNYANIRSHAIGFRVARTIDRESPP